MKLTTAPIIGLIALALPLALALTYMLVNPAFAETATTAAQATPVGDHASWAMLGAAIAAGLASLGAAYAVAIVGSAAVGVLAEKPELLGRLLIFVGLAEGIAIYGLIVAVLILNKV